MDTSLKDLWIFISFFHTVTTFSLVILLYLQQQQMGPEAEMQKFAMVKSWK